MGKTKRILTAGGVPIMLAFGSYFCDRDRRQYFSTLSKDFLNENPHDLDKEFPVRG